MQLKITAAEGCKPYVAKILGPDRRYGFNREFLNGARSKLRATKGCTTRTRHTYLLADGIYEICDSDERSYVAVVNNRRTSLGQPDLLAVIRLLDRCRYDFRLYFQQWASSSKRSAKTFVTLAKHLTKDLRASINAERREARVHETTRRSGLTAAGVFEDSDAADTRSFLARLEKAGRHGLIAAQLFRCQKASTRAKSYGGNYRDLAYGRKGDALRRLCRLLGRSSQFGWGWKQDPCEAYAPWVLYVDLPQGQVSFHSVDKYNGSKYAGDWDGQHASEARILEYCGSILAAAATEVTIVGGEGDTVKDGPATPCET